MDMQLNHVTIMHLILIWCHYNKLSKNNGKLIQI